MSVFESAAFDDHEGVHYFSDPVSDLKVIIAVHNTRRGPAAGGTRLWAYPDTATATDDALRLSRAMSYKNAMADIPFGGGKAVILRPPSRFDRAALFAAYGRAIETLGGVYCTAEDVGVSTDDMRIVRQQTRYVGGLNEGAAASGDPSPVTADGVFRGLHVAAKHALGRNDLSGARVAVQGLGHVGYNLCQRLHRAGASLIVADINQTVIDKAKAEFGAVQVSTETIHSVDVDIYAPCALGGAVNAATVNDIQAKVVGGAANNQLATPDMGQLLLERGILYCPDYVINGGGIINVAAELSGTYNPDWVDAKLEGLKLTLAEIFKASQAQNIPADQIADKMAQTRIYGGIELHK